MEGQVILGNAGFAVIKSQYNENGFLTEQRYYDDQNNPVKYTSAEDVYGIVRTKPNECGQYLELCYYDEFGNVHYYDNQTDNYLAGITDADAQRRLNETYGARGEQVAKLFAKAYPDHALADALFINNMPSGGLSRWGLINPTNGILHLLNRNGVPSYNYVVAYDMPYFGGQTMHHTGDIAFWFAAIDTIRYQMKGDETAARRVSDQMADALAAFAATGDPSTPQLAWKPFTTYEHYTMVFDRKSALKDEYDLELYKAMMTK